MEEGALLPLPTASIHPSIVCYPFHGVTGFFAGANPSCPWVRAGYSLDSSSSQGSSLMAEAAMQGVNANLGFSILLKDTSTSSSAHPRAGI